MWNVLAKNAKDMIHNVKLSFSLDYICCRKNIQEHLTYLEEISYMGTSTTWKCSFL